MTPRVDKKGPWPQPRSMGRRYPWYDSGWLSKFEDAREILSKVRPDLLPTFLDALGVLRTSPGFRTTLLRQPFDEATRAAIGEVVASLRPADLELHEARGFGRFVVHDHPFFTQLQREIGPLVGEAAGEPVEPMYNFLSLYAQRGVCPLHMDSPEAKYTLDFCIDQSSPWPIYVSDVQPWPESADERWRSPQWESTIKQSASLNFTPHILQTGEALVFSGSSQWHYREPIPDAAGQQFSSLLFFHFIPKGTAELVTPANWARLFGVPELAAVNCP
jgi:hypothetical protein